MAIMACQLTVLLCEHDKKILQPCFDPQLCSYVRGGEGGGEGEREESKGSRRVRGEGSAQN